MRARPLIPALLVLCGADVQARDVPQKLRDLYNAIKDRGSCSNDLANGFWATASGSNTYSYCGDHLDDGIIYIQGKNGALADMDIDCDGVQGGPADDGRCAFNKSPDMQDTTAFQNSISRYRTGISDLNTYVHPYVVFGNTGRKDGWRTFDPTEYGVQPLSVIAVICGDKLVYGVWGDTNGDDGSHPMVGETSLALATACNGDSMTGSHGYSETDVLYLAFTKKEAVPGARGADWNAADYETFAKSIEQLGDRLVDEIGSSASRALAEWRLVVAAAIIGVIWVTM
ncbi:fungal chitosanase of glycosyl hydrolase group 75-domain-containing protein [Podospora aff. communis PSN243]|uniref:Endo-chitosanase n=1 Tax=Podospora aff. communis PSN243 TaxID=3040156 RepID=A0AAV9G7K6_9PEZI|nr:fungal chitosanase of glycosyl hydrolase group 75-domain-containing protein [Podospora aff. communis PSN243]